MYARMISDLTQRHDAQTRRIVQLEDHIAKTNTDTRHVISELQQSQRLQRKRIQYLEDNVNEQVTINHQLSAKVTSLEKEQRVDMYKDSLRDLSGAANAYDKRDTGPGTLSALNVDHTSEQENDSRSSVTATTRNEKVNPSGSQKRRMITRVPRDNPSKNGGASKDCKYFVRRQVQFQTYVHYSK